MPNGNDSVEHLPFHAPESQGDSTRESRSDNTEADKLDELQELADQIELRAKQVQSRMGMTQWDGFWNTFQFWAVTAKMSSHKKALTDEEQEVERLKVDLRTFFRKAKALNIPTEELKQVVEKIRTPETGILTSAFLPVYYTFNRMGPKDDVGEVSSKITRIRDSIEARKNRRAAA